MNEQVEVEGGQVIIADIQYMEVVEFLKRKRQAWEMIIVENYSFDIAISTFSFEHIEKIVLNFRQSQIAVVIIDCVRIWVWRIGCVALHFHLPQRESFARPNLLFTCFHLWSFNLSEPRFNHKLFERRMSKSLISSFSKGRITASSFKLYWTE